MALNNLTPRQKARKDAAESLRNAIAALRRAGDSRTAVNVEAILNRLNQLRMATHKEASE